MKLDSIRLRLVAAGGAAVVLSLALAAAGLDFLFERHVRRLAVVELAADLDQLAAGLEEDAAGRLVMVQSPTDPRYGQPLSGLYWQVDSPDERLASRSLWDSAIVLPGPDPRDGRPHQHIAAGPGGGSLLVLERTVFAPRFGPDGVRIMVALRNDQLRSAARAFVRDLAPWLAGLAALLIVGGWVQVVVGLRPLATVGARVAAIRSGAAARLGEDFPIEVRPLAAEVDALIAAREDETRRARTRAADLAHGLKTPLQALIGEAERLRAAGAVEAADGIEEIAGAMRRHVDRELARARIASAGHAVSSAPAAVIGRLLAVIRRTEQGARIAWEVNAPHEIRARIDVDDLTEALGALLDNAARHAAERVAVTVRRTGETVEITITDDGPGIPESRIEELTARGARLDTTGPGTGLGLAIAQDIADAAGGRLTLANAAPGLTATLSLPAVPA
ncbi:HAMP domain-containing sensor histidine kinase [Amaricoccus sp.]|uniref:sensor histidine kinase n=1 Tax=Amaricoccus sp. TaxID=1872485 RepID=UPI002624DC4E|nr:HAMP domain-containing sensor histidine kinase [Amaricoccus sp.]HRO11773.1 HAMP domain-containing sensor histidine kinase [Amaricoccus sp.]